jgi:hypothetical protein
MCTASHRTRGAVRDVGKADDLESPGLLKVDVLAVEPKAGHSVVSPSIAARSTSWP